MDWRSVMTTRCRLVVGGKVGILAVILNHLVLRFLLRLDVFFLGLLLLLVGLARCAGVGLGTRRRHRQVWQQGAETQKRENENRANSFHRFLWDISDSTTCWKSFFHYGSKPPHRADPLFLLLAPTVSPRS